MIKAAFFDVDGTLLSHRTRSVPQSARDAIDALKARGIHCVVATGRQLPEMEKLPVKDIPFDGYITMNGQLILDCSKQVIKATPIEGQLKDILLRMFEERKYPVLLVERDRMYLNFVNDHVIAAQADISSPIPAVDTYSGREIYQVCIYLTEAQTGCLEPLEPLCHINRWHWGGVDIVTRGNNKSVGIRDYLESRNLLPEEAIAFGDGDNDVEMLRFAGIGVAMENGSPLAKAAADYVTADIDQDGIMLALRHFGLL